MTQPVLIFDCDGVLADTERDGHLVAFNATFEHFGLPVRWSDDDYRVVLAIGGGKERLATLFAPRSREELGLPDDPEQQRELIARWHRYKTERYTDLVRAGRLPARPGVRRIALEAQTRGWRLAVASTSAEASVRAVLGHVMGSGLAEEFTVSAGDVVERKKPAPDIYLHALDQLGVDASTAIAIEDSSNGLRASLAAGIATVVTTSSYTAEEDFTGASLAVDSLGDLPAAPSRVVADPLGLQIDSHVTLADLARILARP